MIRRAKAVHPDAEFVAKLLNELPEVQASGALYQPRDLLPIFDDPDESIFIDEEQGITARFHVNYDLLHVRFVWLMPEAPYSACVPVIKAAAYDARDRHPVSVNFDFHAYLPTAVRARAWRRAGFQRATIEAQPNGQHKISLPSFGDGLERIDQWP